MKKALDKLSWLIIIVFVVRWFYQPKLKRKNNERYEERYLEIKRQDQKKNNWCWLACAAMLSDYLSYGMSQEEISRHVRGDESNNPGLPYMIKRALNTALYRNVGWYFRLSLENIKISIDNGLPVIISVRRKGLFAKGHAVIVSGYKGESIYIIDPAKGCKSKLYSYIDLCKGTNMESGYGRYIQSYLLK